MENFFFLEAAPAGGGGGLMTIAMIVILGAFIFFNWRSSKKQQKQINQMMDALEVGDEVTLKCGLIGEIVSIREETITVVTSKDKTKVRFLKTAIHTVDVKASDKRAAQNAKD